MKIGIVTLPLRLNYGGILQNWALQTVLRRMGHDVVTLDPQPYFRLSWKRLPFAYTKRILKCLLGLQREIRTERRLNREFVVKQANLRPFIDKNIKIYYYRNLKEFSSEDFDALIVGSDQVWRPKYNKSWGRHLRNMFLDFAVNWNVRRIAYGASFGTDQWEYTKKKTRACARMLQYFDTVSVREVSGVKLCKEWFGRDDVMQVLDPTLLLDKEDYEKIVEDAGTPKSPGNMMCYLLDMTDEEEALIQYIATERQLIPFHTNARLSDKTLPLEEHIQPPLEKWLRGFMDAELVVTDSFHACVFSIIFRKPFLVIGNEKRGLSRYYSLLSLFGMEGHLLLHPADYRSDMDLSLSVDLHERLSLWQQKSMDFLRVGLDA